MQTLRFEIFNEEDKLKFRTPSKMKLEFGKMNNLNTREFLETQLLFNVKPQNNFDIASVRKYYPLCNGDVWDKCGHFLLSLIDNL